MFQNLKAGKLIEIKTHTQSEIIEISMKIAKRDQSRIEKELKHQNESGV